MPVTAVLLCLVLGCAPKGGPVRPDFARGPCLLHRKPFGVTSQVDVYVVRSYSILSSPRRIVVINGCLVLRSLGEKQLRKMMSFVGFASRNWSFENLEEGHVFILLLRWLCGVVVVVVMLSWLS